MTHNNLLTKACNYIIRGFAGLLLGAMLWLPASAKNLKPFITDYEWGYVDENGVLTFEGLGEGTYTITELVAPNGYNLLKDPITITITANATLEGCTWTVKNGETGLTAGADHLFAFDVENNSGTELPSTGGTGTTIFYILGSLLVVVAGVVLVTRKRMNASEN